MSTPSSAVACRSKRVRSKKLISEDNAASKSDEENNIIFNRKKNSIGEVTHVSTYAKGKLLGKGGFAKCFFVKDQDTNINYAMKIVPKRILQRQKARDKLASEIRIHRTLCHPRIVRFDLFFEDKESVYILLELCQNQTLHDLIKREKKFPEDEVRRFITQIVSALSYCHKNGIIHRDLKLGNIFLDRNWNVKLGDFGLATKLKDRFERKRTMCGTPNYIAPEILDGKNGHSFEVDIWSLGVILYTLLVGKPPYESTDVKSTYERILENRYSFPKCIELSEPAKNLVHIMLQTEPRRRPTAEKVLQQPFIRMSSTGLPDCRDKQGTCDMKVRSNTRLPLEEIPLDHLNNSFENRTDNYEISRKNLARFRKRGNSDHISDAENRLKVDDYAIEPRKYSLRSHDKKVKTYSAPTRPLGPTKRKLSGRSSSDRKIENDLVLECKEEISAGRDSGNRQCRTGGEINSKRVNTPSNADPSHYILPSGIEDTLEYMFKQLAVREAPSDSPTLEVKDDPNFVCITHYVDYCSKYGLGYVLSNGSIGVFFNDSTKIIAGTSGQAFQYWHRTMGTGANARYETFALDGYPESLKKKATLLLHFRAHLLSLVVESGNPHPMQPAEALDGPMVHLKKFVRTKNSYLFRLSNRSIHVVFCDATELVLTSDCNIRYVNKERRVEIFSIGQLRSGGASDRLDVRKRLNYTKDMISQLLPVNADK